MASILKAVCFVTALSADASRAAEKMPIFDTHMHYSRDAWSAFDPSQIAARIDAAGVRWGMVSSTPDDGTLTLHRRDPARFIPALRPYRGPGDMMDWFESKEVLAYIEARLDRAPYRAIGEFHLYSADQVQTSEMRRIAALAADRGIHLHVHSGAGPVEALLELRPGLKILWAHAGMNEPPDIVAAMLDHHALVSAELSFRAGDIAGGGRIDPAWRALLIRHSDRFMIGSDTYINSRWDEYPALIAEHRDWLSELPGDVAKAIAWCNAVRLLGVERARVGTDIPAHSKAQ